MASGQLEFISNIEEIRRRARQKLEDAAVTPTYEGSVASAVQILNDALATEVVCILRYKFHAFAGRGINSEAVRKEFAEHASEEEEHADMIAERITQLGGDPNFNPDGLLKRSASEYVEGEDLVGMIKEDLIAERVAIDTYRDMIRYFANHDPTTRRMLEEILAKEEEHADEMHDLLVAHEGRPMLEH